MFGRRGTSRPVGALLMALGLVGLVMSVPQLVQPAAAATPGGEATTPAVAARAAASWAVGQLTDGSHVEGLFGPDAGLTADVVLALAASGTSRPAAEAAGDWLAGAASDYVTGGIPGDVSAGSAAKLALVARAQGRDPAAFGSLDLDATLRGRLNTDGRFTDSLDFGGPTPVDQSTTFTQSLAILALRPAVPTEAVTFLGSQRCPDGGFPVFYPAPGAACDSDVDGTGVVVQALLAAGAGDQVVPAVRWLLGRQDVDGSFSSSGPGAAANSNSTALAAQALRAAGEAAAADRAVSWLMSRQVRCGGSAVDRGAIGFLDPVADDSALRATAQAIPALAGVALGELDGAVSRASDGGGSIPCAGGPAPTVVPSTATRTVTSTVTRTVRTTATSLRVIRQPAPPSSPTPTASTATASPTPSVVTSTASTTAAVAPAAGDPSPPTGPAVPARLSADRAAWERVNPQWGLFAGGIAVAAWLGLLVGQRRPRVVST